MRSGTKRFGSASNVSPVPRKPFIGKKTKDQDPSRTSFTGERSNPDFSSATLTKAALGRAVMWAESRFAEEINLARLACLGPNSN